MSRSAEEVLHDHLERRKQGDLRGDIAANYADDVLVISKDGVFRGHDGVRHTASILEEMLPAAEFSYDLVRIADGVGLLSWSARAANGARTRFGADTFVIRDGLIRVQTIHYDVGGGS